MGPVRQRGRVVCSYSLMRTSGFMQSPRAVSPAGGEGIHTRKMLWRRAITPVLCAGKTLLEAKERFL